VTVYASRAPMTSTGEKSTESNGGPTHSHDRVGGPQGSLTSRSNPITPGNRARSMCTRPSGEDPRDLLYGPLTDDLTFLVNICIVKVWQWFPVSLIEHGQLSVFSVSSVVRAVRTHPFRGSNVVGEPPPTPRRSFEAAWVVARWSAAGGRHHAPRDGHRRRCVRRIRRHRIPTAGCDPAQGERFHKPVTAPRQLEPRRRRSVLFPQKCQGIE
jgi:hypothetical protein